MCSRFTIVTSEVSLVNQYSPADLKLSYSPVSSCTSHKINARIITDRDMSVLKDFVQLIPKLIATHYDFDGNQNTPS